MRTAKIERYWIKCAKSGRKVSNSSYGTFEEACQKLTDLIKCCEVSVVSVPCIITLERIETQYDEDGFILESSAREITVSTVKNI